MTPLLDIKQTAELLSVSSSLVYQLIESGQLRALRVGTGRGVIRIRVEDIQAYLAECQIETAEEPLRAPRPKLKHLRI